MEHLSNDELEAAKVTANVLESSAMIRARQQEISNRLAEVAQRRVELEGSAEHALLSEMQLMMERMRQLYEHPLRARMMGKSALQVMRNKVYDYSVETNPVPDGVIGVRDGEELVFSGLVYLAALNDDCQIGISRLIENQNLREAAATQRLYAMRTYDEEVGKRVLIYGSEFQPFEEAQERYSAVAGAWRFPELRRGVELGMLSHDRADYILPDDDMYLKPLTLVMQGNMLLGAKRKQP